MDDFSIKFLISNKFFSNYKFTSKQREASFCLLVKLYDLKKNVRNQKFNRKVVHFVLNADHCTARLGKGSYNSHNYVVYIFDLDLDLYQALRLVI